MARLGDFATLLQLGFGLNAALPAIFVIYERAEEIVGAADGRRDQYQKAGERTDRNGTEVGNLTLVWKGKGNCHAVPSITRSSMAQDGAAPLFPFRDFAF